MNVTAASFGSITYEKWLKEWEHRFLAGHIRTLHSLAKMWTFGAFFLCVEFGFCLFSRSSLDSLGYGCVYWLRPSAWFNSKGHVLMSFRVSVSEASTLCCWQRSLGVVSQVGRKPVSLSVFSQHRFNVAEILAPCFSVKCHYYPQLSYLCPCLCKSEIQI